MTCEHCIGAEKLFDLKSAKKELKAYLKKGPQGATKELIKAISAQDLKDTSLLDIGGGIGSIQLELESHGVSSIASIDASMGYQSILKEEVGRRGLEEKFQFLHGDFTDLADEVISVDVVTLDKVTCCYPDLDKLLQAAMSKSRSILGLVHPKSSWWIKAFQKIGAVYFWATKNAFRFYPHPVTKIDSIITANGFKKIHSARGFFWITSVYQRAT